MNKTEAKDISNELREIAIRLDKVELFNRKPSAMENVLTVLSFAENFDYEYGQKLRGHWQDYKDKGLEREDLFKDFVEKILQLAVDIETYFSNDDNLADKDETEYIRKSIVKAIKKGGREFNYKKLLALTKELNHNFKSKNTYSCLMLVRAILDHIPPLLSFTSFGQLVNNYPLFSQTDKAYAKTLLEKKNLLHDALHRQISKSEDLTELIDLPDSMHVNRILQICLEGEVTASQISQTSRNTQKKQRNKISFGTPPPIVECTIQSISGGPQGQFAEFHLTNKGQGIAILKSLEITGVSPQDLGTFNVLGTNEQRRIRVQLDDPDFKNKEQPAKLSVTYKDINGNEYKSAYDVQKKGRADTFYRLESISNFNFFQI